MTRIERVAYYIDAYRVVPRLCLAGHAALVYRVSEWFMALKDPSVAAATFVSVVYGVTPLLLNFYMQNGVNWDAKFNKGGSNATAVAVAGPVGG